jgi:hypothetical protein
METSIRLSLTIFLSIFAALVSAQEQQGFGLLFNQEDFSKIPRMPEQISGTKSLNTIPLSKDLLPYAPTQTRQGKTLSCVSWATAYYAYSIQYAMQHHMTDRSEIDKIALSAMYPYKKLRPNCEAGLDIFKVADFMKKEGNVPYEKYPVNACNQQLPTGITPIFPIKDYQAVFDNAKDTGNKKVQAVLQAIGYNDFPVVVGMQVGDKFVHLEESDPFYDPKKETAATYGHAMTVIGYDMRKKAFRILNSWGDEWGQQGCFWIKFDDFAAITQAGIILILPEEAPSATLQPVAVSKVGGAFGFQYLDDKTSDFVRTSPVHSGGGMYQLAKKDWPVGQAFQLLTNNSRSGLSMCVFSINGEGKLTQHWPRKEFGLETSDKLPIKNYDMVIPGPDAALMIEEPGTDYLCVLYSDNTLAGELPLILDRIEKGTGDVQSRIRQGLGSRMMEPKNVRYESREMRFNASGDTGDTVPLILKIESTTK